MDAERVASSFALIAFAAVAKLLLLCDCSSSNVAASVGKNN
jgi:hypothetical protein